MAQTVNERAKEKTQRPRQGEVVPQSLTLALSTPGMTPLLKAGIGGLAASLRTMSERSIPSASPFLVAVGPGEARVDETSIELRWPEGRHEEVIEALFAKSFQLSPEGIICLSGAYPASVRADSVLLAHLQGALKRTFLSHGKSTPKCGESKELAFRVDDVQTSVEYQPYRTYAQRDAASKVIDALRKGAVELASWAYPGAVVRHNAFAAHTKAYFDAHEVLAACFSLVGCLSFSVPQKRSGALVIPEPTNLLAFAIRRPLLTPTTVAETIAAGSSDAALWVELSLKHTDGGARGIGRVHAALLRGTAWDKKQKYRVDTVALGELSEWALDSYERMSAALPHRLRVVEEKMGRRPFVARSWLRWFAAENLAHGRPWFFGFGSAMTDETRPRILHRYRTQHDNLGALYREDRRGITAMLDELEDAQRALVDSVHVALRQRLGAIAEESQSLGLPAMKTRWNRERDRWRHAFAGAKTQAQVRAALADLWSCSGLNKPLQESWSSIVPLLSAHRWEEARDLALIALASYVGRAVETDVDLEETLDNEAEKASEGDAL